MNGKLESNLQGISQQFQPEQQQQQLKQVAMAYDDMQNFSMQQNMQIRSYQNHSNQSHASASSQELSTVDVPGHSSSSMLIEEHRRNSSAGSHKSKNGDSVNDSNPQKLQPAPSWYQNNVSDTVHKANEERRLRRLARNRESARLRRQRLKSSVAIYEERVKHLEHAIKLINNYHWGQPCGHARTHKHRGSDIDSIGTDTDQGLDCSSSSSSSSSSDDSVCTESTLERLERVLNAASVAAETTSSPSFILNRLQQPREQRIIALKRLIAQHKYTLSCMHDIQLENMTIAWMKEIICQKREMEDGYKSKVQEFERKTNDIVNDNKSSALSASAMSKTVTSSSRCRRRWSTVYWGTSGRTKSAAEEKLAAELKLSVALNDVLQFGAEDIDKKAAYREQLTGGGSLTAGCDDDDSAEKLPTGLTSSSLATKTSLSAIPNSPSSPSIPTHDLIVDTSDEVQHSDSGLGQQVLELEILHRCISGLEHRILELLTGRGFTEVDRVYQVRIL